MTTIHTVTLAYTAYVGNQSTAAVVAQMASVPLPMPLFATFGVRVVSDGITESAGPPPTVTRTIVLALNASVLAVASAIPTPGDGYPIGEVNVSVAGSGYCAMPLVSTAQTSAIRIGKFRATLKTVGATVISEGADYTAPTLTVVGRVLPGGTPTVLTPTVGGGEISAVTVTTAGGPYAAMPVVVISDTTGSGALIQPLMGVKEVDVLDGGEAFQGPITVAFEDLFPNMWPANQIGAFYNLLTVPLTNAIRGPIVSHAPVYA